MKNNTSKRLTIYDLAEKAGLSIATVSRVLNNAPNVNEQTRLKVMKLLDKTSYKPKVIKNKLPCISVLMEAEGLGQDIFNSYNTSILSGISDYAFKHGIAYSVFPFSEKSLRHPDDLIRLLQERGINGIIVIYRNNYDKYLASLNVNIFPHFSIGGGKEISPFSIELEEDEAVKMALDYLGSLKHRKIAFLNIDYHGNSPGRRLAAFKKYADTENLIFTGRFHLSYKKLGYETVLEFKDKILAARPDAMVCMDDNIALGAMKALSEIGFHVPDDISVIGFNDCDFSEYTSPPLTSVSHPFYDIGYHAAENVFCWLNTGEPVRDSKSFRPQLIPRKSCVMNRRTK